jgi:hypothetical protein
MSCIAARPVFATSRTQALTVSENEICPDWAPGQVLFWVKQLHKQLLRVKTAEICGFSITGTPE